MIEKISESFLIISIILSIATVYSYINNMPNFNSLLITNLIFLSIPVIYNFRILFNILKRVINKIFGKDRIIFQDYKKKFSISQGNFLLFIAIIWLIFGLIASIPFYMKTGNLINSLFESYSAVTTSGFSIIDDIEYDLYLYRSLLEWIGGLGITSFILSLLKGTSGKYLVNYSGIQTDYRDVFRKMFFIYLIFTILIMLILILTGRDWFDAALLALVSISNGGFKTIDDNLDIIQKYIVGIGMLISSISAVVYIYKKELKGAFIFLIYLFSIALISHLTGLDLNDAILLTLTTATSGGYELTRPELKDIHIFIYSIAMLIGGMVASTAGGIKINRLWGAIVNIRNYIFSKFYNSKSKIVNENILIITLFLVTYLITVVVHLIEGFGLRESIFNSASVISNCGYSLIDYSNTSDQFKIYLIMALYISRIEIIPFLVLIFKLLNR